MYFNLNFRIVKEILKKIYNFFLVVSKKVVFLQCVTMYIHSSLSGEFTLFVKGFINFGFWFWESPPLKRRFLFLYIFLSDKEKFVSL